MMEKVVIWGKGNYYREYETKLREKYAILKCVDSNCVEKEKNSLSELRTCDKVVVMIRNEKDMFDVIHFLGRSLEVAYEQIIVGKSLFPEDDEIIWGDINEDGRVLIEIDGISLRIGSFNEFYNVVEVLKDRCYEYLLNNEKEDVVIDVGMNIGDSTLYFLHNEKVHRVFGYEPFPSTYQWAEQNLQGWESRVETFPFGLSDCSEQRELRFNPDMPDAQSTISDLYKEVSDDFQKRGLIDSANDVEVTIEVRDAAVIVEEIVNRFSGQYNLVLKMDCEGEEYRVLPRLHERKLLSKMDFIMVEWHYGGKLKVLDLLKKGGFSYWHFYKSAQMGVVYAWR